MLQEGIIGNELQDERITGPSAHANLFVQGHLQHLR